MRVLLRDVATGLYFREPESWTADAEEARSFAHSAEAMDLAREHRIPNAEVVLTFEAPAYTVSLLLP